MNIECPAVAVDVVCYHTATGKIAIIERKYPPLGYALPGGFIDKGETAKAAALREMKEELNVDVKNLTFIGYFDEPTRDPRRHVISFAFLGWISELPVAGDDAKTVTMMTFDEALKSTKLCFDHEQIILKALEKISPR